MTLDEIEEILYEGDREQIEQVLKKYQISYDYGKEYRGFSITSKKLLVTCRSYRSHYIPNCVKYFGNKYNVKE